jgi:hypothetical protein
MAPIGNGSAKPRLRTAIQPLPNVWRPEMPSEFPVDLGRAPIGGLPCLKSSPNFSTLVALHVKKSTVALGVDPDVAVPIKLEPMTAGKMT